MQNGISRMFGSMRIALRSPKFSKSLDEKINRRLERATEPKSREIFAEIRRFCRDGMMVGLHTEFPKIYDEDQTQITLSHWARHLLS